MSAVPAFALLVVLGLAGAPALAQTTGSIEGTVSDSNGGSLPGVAVDIKSPALLGTRSVVTDAAGRYKFPAIPPGVYTVSAALSGFTKAEKTNVRVPLGGTATVAITISVSIKEEVVVTGEAPVVDTTSTTAGTAYTAAVMGKLPLGRNYADVARQQPGVQEDNGETQGRSLALSVYGSTSAENLFLIDGVNTTNVIKGFQGKAINSEFVEEVEVKTGGYQAEYGRNTGGVVNVITKGGGNEFHGGVFGYFENASTRAKVKVEQTPAFSQSGDAQLSSVFPKNTRLEGGASLGGYFIKDRIWFFGAYNKTNTDRTTQPQAGDVAGQDFPQEFDGDMFSAKLTFRLGPSTDIQATMFADPQSNTGSLTDTPTSLDPDSYNGTRDVGGTDYALKVNQILGTWGLVSVQGGHHADSYLTTVPNVQRVQDRTNEILHDGTVTATGGQGSIFGPTTNNESTRDQVRGSLSLFMGRHEVKVGGDYQKEITKGSTYYTGKSLLQIYPCQDEATYECDLSKAPVVQTVAGPIPVFYRHDYYSPSGTDLNPMVSSPFEVPNELYSIFVQDEWKVLPNLVVNAGIRYDDQKVFKGDNSLAFDLNNQWSPRLGFSWDFLNDGSSKLYGSVGRFHYATPTDLNVRVFTANTSVRTYNYSASSVDQDAAAPRERLIQVGSLEGEPIDAGMKAAYQDEFTIGVDKAIDSTFSLGIKYTYRTLGRTIEDRCDLDSTDPLNGYSSCALFNPGGSGPAASGQIATCNGTGNPTDLTAGECTSPGVAIPDVTRKFQGFELVARKRIGESFWAQASYLYSKLEGNYSGAIRTASSDGTGQTDPGINADFDYYQFNTNAYGKLDLDRPHQFRASGTYTFPFGLSTSLGFYVRSGVPYSKLGWFNDFYPDLLYLSPRGSEGRTPTEWDADLSLSYDLKLGAVTVSPQVFVFSAFNNQIVTFYNTGFNPLGTFVTEESSPYYGQPGITPGEQGCPVGGQPCTDNVDYLKAGGRTNPRVIRFAVKVAF
ncbi:MAG: TonB-dependent receptor [Holophagales bacterium]|nr:TonB-dependent receptor [Holophagales bacterium]